MPSYLTGIDCLPLRGASTGVAGAPVNPRRTFTCLTVALHAFTSSLLPTLRPQLHEVRTLCQATFDRPHSTAHMKMYASLRLL